MVAPNVLKTYNTDIVKLERSLASNTKISNTGAKFITRVPMAATIAVGTAASAIMLIDLFKEEEKPKKDKEKPVFDFKVAPTFSSEYTGLNLWFRF